MANLLPEIATNKTAIQAAEKAKQMLAIAQLYVIDSPAMAEAANEDLKSIKSIAKALDDTRKEIKKPFADKATAVDKFFKEPKDFLDKAESCLKKALSGFLFEQERKRREAEERAREAAQAELVRMEEERKARASVQELDLNGAVDADFEEVQPPPVVPTEVVTWDQAANLSGLVQKKIWKAEVTDLKALLQAVIDGIAPADCVVVDQSFLNKMATSFKGSIEIPGVLWKEETSLASRG